jgi:anti-sigma B factor antagonist
MNLQTDSKDGVIIAKFSGNLLGETYYQPMVDMVQEKIAGGEKHFILELSELQYANSTGLGGMLTMLTKARNAGGELILVAVPDSLRKLIEMTKLDKIFREEADIDSAIQSLKS